MFRTLFFSAVIVLMCQGAYAADGGSSYVTVSQLDPACVTRVTSLEEDGISPFVLQLPQGTVINEGGVFTQEKLILKDTMIYTLGKKECYDQVSAGVRDRCCHRILAAVRNEKGLTFEGRLAVISSPGAENWYHWLLQILPRLLILARSSVSYDRIYINNVTYPWQLRSLEIVLSFLHISKEKMLIVNGDCVMRASVLVVPSVPFIPSRGVFLPEWMNRSLKSIFLSQEGAVEKKEVYERIYISRSKALIRGVVNEDEYTPALQELGFKIVHPETLSPFEQASLFNGAKVIIAPHGSGLSNVIFSKPGCKVIEIDKDDERRGCFKPLTESVGGTFFPFYAQPVGPEDKEDMKLNVAEFMSDIRKIIQEKV